MAIAAKRFDFLNNETNIATSPFSSKLGSDILNTGQLLETETPTSLQELIDSAIQSELGNASKETLDDVSRAVKDIKSSMTDLSSLAPDKLDDYVKNVVGGDSVALKSIKNILKKCSSNRGLGLGVPGKPYDVSMNCGAGDISLGTGRGKGGAGCDASSYNDLLSKMTGGAYNATFKDISDGLKKLMALAGYGLDMGMCGVFTALSDGLPKDALSKAAGSLLEYAGASGNVNGVLDLARSSPGLTPLLYAPGAITTAISSFKMPKDTRQQDLGGLGERFMGGLELLDEEWDRSELDHMPSIANAQNYQSDLGEVFSASLTDRSFSNEDIDVPIFDDRDFVMAAYLVQIA